MKWRRMGRRWKVKFLVERFSLLHVVAWVDCHASAHLAPALLDCTLIRPFFPISPASCKALWRTTQKLRNAALLRLYNILAIPRAILFVYFQYLVYSRCKFSSPRLSYKTDLILLTDRCSGIPAVEITKFVHLDYETGQVDIPSEDRQGLSIYVLPLIIYVYHRTVWSFLPDAHGAMLSGTTKAVTIPVQRLLTEYSGSLICVYIFFGLHWLMIIIIDFLRSWQNLSVSLLHALFATSMALSSMAS